MKETEQLITFIKVTYKEIGFGERTVEMPYSFYKARWVHEFCDLPYHFMHEGYPYVQFFNVRRVVSPERLLQEKIDYSEVFPFVLAVDKFWNN